MKGKKITAWLLTVLMVLGLFPFAALPLAAAEEEPAAASAGNTEPTLSSSTVVYVADWGDDAEIGDDSMCPVRTLTRAYEVLGDNGGTIVLVGDVYLADEPTLTYEGGVCVDGRYIAPAHTGLVVITAYDEASQSMFDGTFYFGLWTDNAAVKANHFILGGPTTFEKIPLKCTATTSFPVIVGRGNFLTMGEGITNDPELYVVGMEQATDKTVDADCRSDKDSHVIIKSGSYGAVVGMARNVVTANYTGTAYVTVEGGTINKYFAGLALDVNNGRYGNAEIRITGGTFTCSAGFAGAAINPNGGVYGNIHTVVTGGNFKNRYNGGFLNGTGGTVSGILNEISGGDFSTTAFDGAGYGCKTAHFGNVTNLIHGGSFKFFSGGVMDAAATCKLGDIAVTLDGNATFSDRMCAGSFRGSFAANSVTLNVTSGTYTKAWGGCLGSGGTATITDSVNINISGGTFSGNCGFLGVDATAIMAGTFDTHINISGGTFTATQVGLFYAHGTTVTNVNNVYYNITGGSFNKLYVGAASRSGSVSPNGKLLFRWSGGNITTLSTAWLTGYQKYYLIGDKADLSPESAPFSTAMNSAPTDPKPTNGWPSVGDNAMNFVQWYDGEPDVIYYDSENMSGNASWKNDGLSPDTPVVSLYDAVASLGADGGTVVLMSDFVTTGLIRHEMPDGYIAADASVTYTSFDGENDYRLYAEPVEVYDDTTGVLKKTMYGARFGINTGSFFSTNTVFDNINLKAYTNDQNIYLQGHDLTVTDTVVLSEDTWEDKPAYALSITAGFYAADLAANNNSNGYAMSDVYSWSGDQTITLNGGTWKNILGGNRRNVQECAIGTFTGTMTYNIGGNAVISNNDPDDDITAAAVQFTGQNIFKGTLNVNITGGVIDSRLRLIGRLGVYYNYVNDFSLAATDGLYPWDDTTFDADVNLNITGGEFSRDNTVIEAVAIPGDTPVHGDFTVNITGGTFAGNASINCLGILGEKNVNIDAALTEKVKAVATDDNALRVITVGDSITWGACAKSVTDEVTGNNYHMYNFNYPMQLQRMFGNTAIVGNFGYSGARAGDALAYDYYKTPAYDLSMNYDRADAVIIALGTNNIGNFALDLNDPQTDVNPAAIENYLNGMNNLIDKYLEAYPTATVYVTTAMPRWNSEVSVALLPTLLQLQAQIVADRASDRVKLMDLYTAMLPYAAEDMEKEPVAYTYYYTDKLHPTNPGYEKMAEAVYTALTSDFHYYTVENRIATCMEAGGEYHICEWCGDTYIENKVDALGHDFSVELERVDATTAAAGYVLWKCSRCDEQKNEVLPQIGKTEVRSEDVPATCTEDGYTRHYYNDGTYADDTFVTMLGHDYLVDTTKATCTKDGLKVTTCSRCDLHEEEILPMTGHVPGAAATCTTDQLCTECGTVLTAKLGHDEHTDVIPAGAHTAGYTYVTCSRCDYTAKRDYVDATDGLVVFVNTTLAAAGDGTFDHPFNMLTPAITYANTAFDRTIVLMSMVTISANYTEATHTGAYTFTSLYDGTKYDGGYNITNNAHYLMSGDDTFENMAVNMTGTSVWRARFHKFEIGAGVTTNNGASKWYLVGGEQAPTDVAYLTKNVDMTISSGAFVEVIGCYRSGAPVGTHTGAINVTVNGGIIAKLALGSRSTVNAAYTGPITLNLNGGSITTWITASDASTDAGRATNYATNVTVNISKTFDIAESFKTASSSGGTFTGIALSNVYTAAAAATLDNGKTEKMVINVAAEIYDDVVESGKILEGSYTAINKISGGTEPIVGDIDEDGELTNSDVAILLQYLAGWEVVDFDVEAYADVTGDGKINNRDAVWMIQKIAGWFDQE